MKKKSNFVWGLSLIIIGVVTLVLAGSNVIGITLPDVVLRILGIVDLIMLPILGYTTVKRRIGNIKNKGPVC